MFQNNFVCLLIHLSSNNILKPELALALPILSDWVSKYFYQIISDSFVQILVFLPAQPSGAKFSAVCDVVMWDTGQDSNIVTTSVLLTPED